MPRRYKIPYRGRQYLADKNAKVIHDLENETEECKIDDIENLEMLDSIFGAKYKIKRQDYTTCPKCLASILMIKPAKISS